MPNMYLSVPVRAAIAFASSKPTGIPRRSHWLAVARTAAAGFGRMAARMVPFCRTSQSIDRRLIRLKVKSGAP